LFGPAWIRHDVIVNVSSVAFFPDGDLLALGQDAGVVQILHARTGKQMKRFVVRSAGPDNFIGSIEFSPDGRTLLTAADNGPVALLRTADFRNQKAGVTDAREPATFGVDGSAVLMSYGTTVEVVPLTDLP
jgi:WD40 repeat protein